VEAVSQTIGYARVSAADQNPALQLDALEAAGCDRVFVEKASGALRVRPQLAAALEYARAGDVFTVYKLDRLGRKVVVLADLMDHLKKREIGFRSLLDGIDTTTAMGRAFFHIQAVFAELERDLIRLERGRGPPSGGHAGEARGGARVARDETDRGAGSRGDRRRPVNPVSVPDRPGTRPGCLRWDRGFGHGFRDARVAASGGSADPIPQVDLSGRLQRVA
jgi:DNA invertase Pin-like site-specific DNA recombinase